VAEGGLTAALLHLQGMKKKTEKKLSEPATVISILEMGF
jgi:hypothetical protein